MCVFRVFANIPIKTFTQLIKTFTMQDVSMEIACKSAVMSMFIRYCFIIKEAFVSRHYEEVC